MKTTTARHAGTDHIWNQAWIDMFEALTAARCDVKFAQYHARMAANAAVAKAEKVVQ